jgi:hypothetical protein
MLNIYPQCFEHDFLQIDGELEDLIKLRDVLTNIIEQNIKADIVEEVFASDGEGYKIIIEVKTEEEMMKLIPHYGDGDYE